MATSDSQRQRRAQSQRIRRISRSSAHESSQHGALLLPPSSPKPLTKLEKLLVIGGSGFLGRHLVDALLVKGFPVRVLDTQQSFEDDRVEFLVGDIKNLDDCFHACQGCDTVFHMASLTNPSSEAEQFYDTNVRGTENVIQACLKTSVTKLIYTSTASVVFAGVDIEDGDESLEYPDRHLDDYSSTKAQAEMRVIAANGRRNIKGKRLLTCSLRPHAMFGPRDTHFVKGLIAKAREGDITHMIGDGSNVMDFTYVDNVVHAHMLASQNLVPGCPVAGQCYFITNGERRKFWDFISRILDDMGCVGPTKTISARVAFIRFQPTITRHVVCVMTCHHWFSHAKATRDFGYRPIVSLDEGLQETVAFFRSQVLRSDGETGVLTPTIQ